MLKNGSSNKMHGVSEIGPNVPAFLVKLWKLVEDPECDLIYWSESGMSFIIVAQARFAKQVLPLHYKHNNMASFIRQLNMYDFHKIASVESGGLKSDKDEMEFAHQYFIRDHPYLLENIKRKLSNPKSGVISTDQITTNSIKNGTQSDIFAKVLSDVNILKGKQESWDARLAAMKRENEALWRELAVFRQKHLKQEQIINRLIHFIVTIVQPSRKVPIRRRFPLMLNDTQQVKKIKKINGTSGSSLGQNSPPGPTIHEIDSNVLIGGNDKDRGIETTKDEETDFESSDFTGENTKYVEIISPAESQKSSDVVIANSLSGSKKETPSDWLEIVLTEDDMITNPLTPIDPAKVNPTVAAATLKHLETNNKLTTPVTITIPSIVSTESGKKKTIPEKKIIYLTEVKKPDKVGRRRQVRPNIQKGETIRSKGSPPKKVEATNSTSTTEANSDTLLEMICDEETSPSRVITLSGKNAASGKRKLSMTSSSNSVKIPNKRQNIQTKSTIEAASDIYENLLTPDSLENTLNCKFDFEPAKGGDISTYNEAGKQSASDDSFWKLESLYNGSIGVNELISEVDDGVNAMEESLVKSEKDFVNSGEKSSDLNLCEIDGNDTELQKLEPKSVPESTDSVVDFPSDSMAVVWHTPCPSNTEDLSRELSSHVDNVQGEIDYLKEVFKGEGYNFDLSNILGKQLFMGMLREEVTRTNENFLLELEKVWVSQIPATDFYQKIAKCFNDDSLPYELLPQADEVAKEKENEKGNEVMTYGTPNLMDLVDLFGSTGTVQDWSSVMSPTSPTVAELVTPAPSPSPASLGKSGKRRKI